MNKVTTVNPVKEQPAASAEKKLERPKRRSFENQGRLKFPPIPGYRLFVAAIDDPNLTHEMSRVEELGYVPVKAEEIGYDKKGFRPLSKGENVYVDLGKGVKGMLMKVPQEWHDEDVADFAKQNNNMLFSKKDSLDSDADKNLIMTQGELSRLKT